MSAYIARRLFSMIPVILVITLIVFALVQLIPGDPAITYLGGEQLDPSRLEAVRHELGLDQPLPVQYVKWLWRALQGDLGQSLVSGQSVLTELRNRIPTTLQVIGFAWLISLAIAFPAGVVSATMRNRLPDVIVSIFAMAGVAMPSFWLGILLITFFAVELRWVPPSGFVSITKEPLHALELMILPCTTLGSEMAASTMRQVRSSVLEVLRQDYVRTARSKGLSARAIMTRHVLRNALLPVITVMGLQLPRLIGGAVIVESMFGIPGMGQLAVGSIFTRDFLVVQAVVLVAALVTLAANLITDLAYALIDPRIKYS
jgi:peptide/nickel transport system permease protein